MLIKEVTFGHLVAVLFLARSRVLWPVLSVSCQCS